MSVTSFSPKIAVERLQKSTIMYLLSELDATPRREHKSPCRSIYSLQSEVDFEGFWCVHWCLQRVHENTWFFTLYHKGVKYSFIYTCSYNYTFYCNTRFILKLIHIRLCNACRVIHIYELINPATVTQAVPPHKGSKNRIFLP